MPNADTPSPRTSSSDRLIAMVDAHERLASAVEEVRARVEELNASSEIAQREAISEMAFRITAFFPACRSGVVSKYALEKRWQRWPCHDAAAKNAGEALVITPGLMSTGPLHYPDGFARGILEIAIDESGRLWLTNANRKLFGGRWLTASGTALWDPILDHEDFPSSAMFKTLAALEYALTAAMQNVLEISKHRAKTASRALGR